MADIFLSYARLDIDRARRLADGLEARGFSVWWDQDLQAGKSFDQVIESSLDSARCVVVLWSTHSVSSDWVKAEASEGRRRAVLVPVLIDQVKIPLEFRRVQTADLTQWQGDPHDSAFTAFVADVSALLASSAASPGPAVVAPKPMSARVPRGVSLRSPGRFVTALLILIATVAVALIAWKVFHSPKRPALTQAPSPPAPAPAPAVRDAKSYTFDGFKLGTPFASGILARSPYHDPCDNDPVGDGSRRLMFYTAGPCNQQAFPERTTVLFYLPFQKGPREYEQPVLAFAWLGGTYFASRSDFPLRPGDPARRAAEVFGVASRRFSILNKLRVDEHAGQIYSVSDGETLIGFVLGSMPADAEDEQWKVVWQILWRYGR